MSRLYTLPETNRSCLKICQPKKKFILPTIYLKKGVSGYPGHVCSDWIFTPRKFNIDPENTFLKGDSSSNHHFSGAMLNFGGVGFSLKFDIFQIKFHTKVVHRVVSHDLIFHHRFEGCRRPSGNRPFQTKTGGVKLQFLPKDSEI